MNTKIKTLKQVLQLMEQYGVTCLGSTEDWPEIKMSENHLVRLKVKKIKETPDAPDLSPEIKKVKQDIIIQEKLLYPGEEQDAEEESVQQRIRRLAELEP